jgi:hypothetical protein
MSRVLLSFFEIGNGNLGRSWRVISTYHGVRLESSSRQMVLYS